MFIYQYHDSERTHSFAIDPSIMATTIFLRSSLEWTPKEASIVVDPDHHQSIPYPVILTV